MKVAVLISGSGSNLQALIDYTFKNPVTLEFVIADSYDKAKCGLSRAINANIPTQIVNYRNYKTKEDAEKEIDWLLVSNDIDLVVLAGYMKILTPSFVSRWKGKLINLHPSLLPSFPGTTSIKDAFDYGVKIAGVTIHYVDEGVDTGQIIDQMHCRIEECWSLNDLKEKIHSIEHELLPKVIDQLAKKYIDI